jgi:Zn-dependent protease with chaperone function
VLTVGLCVLPFLTVAEFKSILAHEFAHFSHADTFWHRFLFQVSLSLRTATREMARTGRWLTWANPFFWFFWLYSKSYSLLSAGFSRSREFLADRMACSLYGSDVFTEALRKVCIDGTHFERVVYKNVARLIGQKQAFVNMYLAFRKHRDATLTPDERARRDKELLDDRPSLFASHPTFPERAAAAAALPKARKPDATPAVGLFENAEAVEQELTDYVTEVMQHGMN